MILELMPKRDELQEVKRFQWKWKWKIEKRKERRVPRTNRKQITLSAVNSIKYPFYDLLPILWGPYQEKRHYIL